MMDDGLLDQRTSYADLYSDDVGEVEIMLTAVQAIDAGRAQVATLEIKLAEMRDLWMRAELETASVKAWAKQDIDAAKQFGTQTLAADAVEAAEGLRRGLDSVPDLTSEPAALIQLHDGFLEVERVLVAMLGRNGIKRHDPTGDAFDVVTQRAVAAEGSSVHSPGTVVRALTSMWTLNGQLLRPALVVLAKPVTTDAHVPRE